MKLLSYKSSIHFGPQVRSDSRQRAIIYGDSRVVDTDSACLMFNRGCMEDAGWDWDYFKDFMEEEDFSVWSEAISVVCEHFRDQLVEDELLNE